MCIARVISRKITFKRGVGPECRVRIERPTYDLQGDRAYRLVNPINIPPLTKK
jgi:hypothetical protein